jgi:hypothetical protein
MFSFTNDKDRYQNGNRNKWPKKKNRCLHSSASQGLLQLLLIEVMTTNNEVISPISQHLCRTTAYSMRIACPVGLNLLIVVSLQAWLSKQTSLAVILSQIVRRRFFIGDKRCARRPNLCYTISGHGQFGAWIQNYGCTDGIELCFLFSCLPSSLISMVCFSTEFRWWYLHARVEHLFRGTSMELSLSKGKYLLISIVRTCTLS